MAVGIGESGAKVSLGVPMRLLIYGLRRARHEHFVGVSCAW